VPARGCRSLSLTSRVITSGDAGASWQSKH